MFVAIPSLALLIFMVWAGWKSWMGFIAGGVVMTILMMWMNEGKGTIVSGMFHAVDSKINPPKRKK